MGVIFLLLTSCQKEKLPSGVLDREQYAALLVDIYLAEARVNGLGMMRDSAAAYYFPIEEGILKSHGLPDSVVSRTYQYYIDHPIELEQVYIAVVDTLSLREQRYKGLVP